MADLAIGAARRDVTPEESVPLSGYPTKIESPAFRDGPRPERSQGVHDPIFVAAMVVSDGERSVAIVASDLLNVYREFCENVRSDLRERGVDVDEVVFTATHTHSAPYMPGLTLEINPFLSYTGDDVTDHVGPIREAFVECVAAAAADRSPGTLRVGTARNDTAVVNRREGESVVDPELTAVVGEREGADPVVLLNYACHPVCFSANTAVISSDYVSVVYERVDDVLPGATPLFVNGAAGDINPRDVDRRTDDEAAYVSDVGSDIAATAVEAIEAARDAGPVTADEILVTRRDLELSFRETPSRAELERRYDDLTDEVERLEAAGDADAAFERRWDRIYVRELQNLERLDADTLPATMQFARIGDLGLVSVPGEAFVKHGLDFKDAATVERLVVAGYANEYVGYLPTLEEMERGGYEVRTCKLSPDAVEQVRTAGLELVQRE